jgi:hypothetical protein
MSISEIDEKLISLLNGSQLLSASLNPAAHSLHLEFALRGDQIKIDLELRDVAHLSFSHDLNEEESRPIDEVVLNPVKDGEPLTVSYTVAYQARYEYAQTIPNIEDGLYHLHVDGGIMIDVVAMSYQIKMVPFDIC